MFPRNCLNPPCPIPSHTTSDPADSTNHFFAFVEVAGRGANYPEMACFRDVVFTFKALMAPTSDALPPLAPWTPVSQGGAPSPLLPP